MLTLITADLHLSDATRDNYRHQWIGEALPALIRQHKVGCLLCLGDLCESKDYHSAWLVNRVVDHFYKLASLCPVVVLRGNHDYLTSADNPFYQFLKRIKGIHWINTPFESTGKLSDKCFPHSLGDVLFLPHTTNYQRDWKLLNFKKYDWIFAHQTFTGADNGHGFRLDGIPLDVFPKDAHVISGDVHKPQTLGCVTYVGAPTTIDFGDDYKPRVLLLDGKKVTSIPCSGPQKRLIELSAGNLAFPISGPATVAKGDILKVRVSISSKQMEHWPEIKDRVHKWGDKHGYIIHQVIPVQTGSNVSKKAVVSKARTDEQIFLDYVKSRKIDERTAKTGRILMQKGG
jgi:DNA repair exonuclease SbcCD nuclease subunit